MNSVRERFIVVSLVLFSVSVKAQIGIGDQDTRGSDQHMGPDEQASLIFYQAFNLPAEDSAKSRLDITFRISNSFFIFVRNEHFTRYSDDSEYTRRWPFIAKADVAVELLDKSGISAARELMRKEIGTNNPERSANRNDFMQGIFSLIVAPDEYTIVFHVNDFESNQEFLDRSQKIRVRDFAKKPLELSDVLLIEPLTSPHEEVTELIPVNLGRDVFFGKNFDAYVEITYNATPKRALELTYSLYGLDDRSSDSTFFARDSLILDAAARSRKLDIRLRENAYVYDIRPSNATNKRAAFLKLKGEQLPEGRYDLRLGVSDGTTFQSHVYSFRVRWIHRPRSLHDLEFAITVLEHIATKDEMSELKTIVSRQRKERFENFWKQRDPTPQTAFNEAMAEYYRRVDYANENFGGLRSAEGWKTDRGKIYILYGQPTSTERKFSPAAAPREIWMYENLKKRFVFVDENRNGAYKLASTESIP